MELTFGIELEVLIPDACERDFPRGGYHHGEQSRLLPTGWEGRWDRSINPDPGYYTLEIVSPILQGIDGFNQVAQVLGVLQHFNVRTNNSCGFHVHIGAEGMTVGHVKTIKQVFEHYEAAYFGQCGAEAVERLTGRGWEYCKTAPAWGGDMDRRQSLNTSNWANGDTHKNTIEVRCFAGTLEPHRVLGGILMATSMVARGMILSSAARPVGLFSRPIDEPDVAMNAFIDLHFTPKYLLIPKEHPAFEPIVEGLKRESRIATRMMLEAVL